MSKKQQPGIATNWHSLIQQIAIKYLPCAHLGFPNGSVGKESTCSAGDPSLIPGSGRSAREEIGYPLQYSWASLVAQLVKNAPAMQETWIWSLAWEDPLEKETATHSSILPWGIPRTVESMGSQRVGHDWATELNWTDLIFSTGKSKGR